MQVHTSGVFCSTIHLCIPMSVLCSLVSYSVSPLAAVGGSATEVTSLAPQLGCRSWLSSHTYSAVNTKLTAIPSLSACVVEAGKLF